MYKQFPDEQMTPFFGLLSRQKQEFHFNKSKAEIIAVPRKDTYE